MQPRNLPRWPRLEMVVIGYEHLDALARGEAIFLDQVFIVPVTALVEPPPDTRPTEERRQ